MVCGSRTITNKDWIYSQLDTYTYWNLACYEELIMVQGCAKGVDQTARQYAVDNGWKIEDYPADWKTYEKAAGFIRNETMVKAADEVFILWDGESKGTKHDIALCQKLNKPYKVLIYNSEKHEDYSDVYVKDKK